MLSRFLPVLRNQRDPWREGRSSSGDGPPDLEEVIAKLTKRVFRGRGQGGGVPTGQPSEGEAFPFSGHSWKWIAGLFILIWAVSGIYVVQQAEQGVVLRFGAYARSVGPGLHWLPRLIERNIVMNVEQVSQFSYAAQMLTKDENIVSVEMSVQYRIDDLSQYLFNVSQPILSLQEATASALRQVVGQTELDDLLTTGRAGVRDDVMRQLKDILAIYRPGLLVTKVSLQPAKPPEEVTDAFNDAIKAREDEQRYINQANAYVSKVLPIAQGQAARKRRAAEAFASEAVSKAKGETAYFTTLLSEYHRAPQVMRERMYLSTLETILGQTTKVLVDLKGHGNVVYLPLEQMLRSAKQPTVDATHGNGMSRVRAEAMDRDLSSTTARLRCTQTVPPVQSYSERSEYQRGYGHAKHNA